MERSCNSTEGSHGELFGFAGREIAGATELALEKCKAKVVPAQSGIGVHQGTVVVGHDSDRQRRQMDGRRCGDLG